MNLLLHISGHLEYLLYHDISSSTGSSICFLCFLQAVDTVVAGILHDVVDDTFESLHSVEQEFGDDVSKLVAGVSRLSYINQVVN